MGDRGRLSRRRDDGSRRRRFAQLTEVYNRLWPDAFGNNWRHDEFGIDANYRTNTVYEWTRRHAGTKALQGRDGWGYPALGIASDQDVDYRGRRIKGGAKLRGVGTWPLKSTFYSHLALMPETEGRHADFPAGYCHFGTFLDEIYFKQITSEYLAKEKIRGRERQIWKERGAAGNHFLDCRIYDMALAEAYFASLTSDDWAERAKERGIPADLQAPDLFAPKEFAPVRTAAAGDRLDRGLYGGGLAGVNKGPGDGRDGSFARRHARRGAARVSSAAISGNRSSRVTDGAGRMTEFTPADIDKLQAYIDSLQAQISGTRTKRRDRRRVLRGNHEP